MSSTITQQLEVKNIPQPESILIQLNTVLKDKVLELCKSMVASKLFPKEMEEKILAFVQKLSQMEPSEFGKGEETSLHLCYLLCEVIRPTMYGETDNDNLLALLGFDDAVNQILEKSVPPGEPVEQFIQTYIQFSLEDEGIKRKLALIEECFREQMHELIKNANQINQELIRKFNTLKERILEMNTKRHNMTLEMNKRYDDLTEKIGKVSKILESHAQDVLNVSNSMKSEDKHFHLILKEAESVLNKV